MPFHAFVDRRQTVYLQTPEIGKNGYPFEFAHKKQTMPAIKAVHDFFLAKWMEGSSFDTIKIKTSGGSYHLHFSSGGFRIIEKRVELRSILSRENHGAWIEEEADGRRRYFVQEMSWFSSGIKEYHKADFCRKRLACSLPRKVMVLALGVLALCAGAYDYSSQTAAIRTQEAVFALMALHPSNPSLRCFGISTLMNHAFAQTASAPTPAGPASTMFRVNNYTLNNQINPKVIGSDDGSFLVSWNSQGQDGDGYGVYAQKYDESSNPLRSEYRVNTNTTGDQMHQDQAELINGNVVFVWSSNNQDGSSWGVYGQIVDSRDIPLGGEFRINTNTTDEQSFPAVRSLPMGGFKVVWQSRNQDGSGFGIFQRRFDSNGSPIGPESQANSETLNDQTAPDFCVLKNGNNVVVWMSQGQDGNGYGVFGQLFDSNDYPIGPEFRVNNYTLDDQSYPKLACLPSGFVVTWSSYNQLGRLNEIYGRIFDDNATALGQEFLINTFTAGDQYFQSVAALNNGFVSAWHDNVQEGNGFGVYAKRFHFNGTANGNEIHINTYVINDQMQPSVAPHPDGFMAIWQSGSFTMGAEFQDGSYFGIFGQAFDLNGNPVGLPNPLTPTDFSSTLPSVPSLSPTTALNLQNATSHFSSPSSTQNMTYSSQSLTPTLNSMVTSHAPQASTSDLTAASSAISIPASLTPSDVYIISTISYGTPYSIFIDGQVVGTFVLSGGQGLFSESNQNSLTVTLDADSLDGLEQGFLLFYASEIGAFDSLTLDSTSGCISLEGNTAETSDGQIAYEVIYSGNSCTTSSLKRTPRLVMN